MLLLNDDDDDDDLVCRDATAAAAEVTATTMILIVSIGRPWMEITYDANATFCGYCVLEVLSTVYY